MMSVATSGARAQNRLRQFTIDEVIHESTSVVTLIMHADEPCDYQAGMFVSVDPHQFADLAHWVAFLEKLKGRKESRRCLSLSSAPHEEFMALTLKVDAYDPEQDAYPPLLGPYAYHALRPGMRIEAQGFSGSYCLNDEMRATCNHMIHLCGGTGMVPNFSIIKEDLARGEHRHTLLYANRSDKRILFEHGLEDWAERYPERLKIRHYFSRMTEDESLPAGATRGHIDQGAIEAVVDDLSKTQFFICGPSIPPRLRRQARKEGRILAPRFMESMLEILTEMGVEGGRIKKERW